MIPSDRLWLDILTFGSAVSDPLGRTTTIGQLGNVVGVADQDRIIKALRSMQSEGLLDLQRTPNAHEVRSFGKLTPEMDEFFTVGQFRLYLTDAGHRRMEELSVQQGADEGAVTGSERPLIFISCGQYTDAERKLGKALADLVLAETGCFGYFAESQTSLDGLTSHIFGALNKAVAFVFVLHRRGKVQTLNDDVIRASVWIEQEIAIAAFLNQTRKEPIQVFAYVQDGVHLEGVRQFVILNAVKFTSESEVLEHFRKVIGGFSNSPRRAEENPLEVKVGYKSLYPRDASSHRYELKVVIKNTGSSALSDYWVEMAFPRLALSSAGVNMTEIGARATHTHRFFRVQRQSLGLGPLYPGDEHDAFPIEYRMDADLLRSSDVLNQLVTVNACAPPSAPRTVTKSFRELQEF